MFYAKAKLVTEKQIFEGRNKGLLKVQKPMPAEVLKRIRQGAVQSDDFAPIYLNVLRAQRGETRGVQVGSGISSRPAT